MGQLRQVKTTQGTLHYYQDWDNYEGGVVMKDAKTINRYKEISNMQPDDKKLGVFFAFSSKQFEEGVKTLVENGHIKDENDTKELQQDSRTGAIGKKEALDAFFGFYANLDKMIAKECDPQEVYFYEYNNYESMLSWDADKEPYNIIRRIWGEDTAKRIKRLN